MGRFKTSKYRFNRHTLSFEHVHVTFKSKLFKLLSYFAAGFGFSIIIVFISWNVLSSPKEKVLKRQIEENIIKFDLLNRQMDDLDHSLVDMEKRDDNVYRVIFETDSINTKDRRKTTADLNLYTDPSSLNDVEVIKNTKRRIDKIENKIYVQSKSFDQIYELAKNKADMIASIPAIMPLAKKSIHQFSSGFGFRIDPIFKTIMLHPGQDFTAPTGTPVYATGNGVVVSLAHVGLMTGSGYGNCIVIYHGFNFHTLYGHLSRIVAFPGKKVKRGDLIGYVGSTGRSTGSHLHYEVIKGKDKVDPTSYFFNDLTADEYDKIINLSSRANQKLD